VLERYKALWYCHSKQKTYDAQSASKRLAALQGALTFEELPMLLPDETKLAEKAVKRAGYRLKTAGTKLNTEELAALEKHCREIGRTPGEFIRDLILAELGRTENESGVNDPTLTEVLGVRLLLVNVLRPLAAGQNLSLEAFDKLLDQISNLKHEMAGKLMAEGRK
jgi:hypothetical protein